MRKKPSLLVPVLGLLLLLAFGAVLFLLLRGPRSIETFEDALAEARRAGKPIFVKIIADTWSNCHWMEDNVFVKPEIRRQLDEYVVVKLSIDGRDGPNLINVRLANERFNCHVIPFYVTLRSDGEETGRYTGSTRSGGYAKFREFVKMGLRP